MNLKDTHNNSTSVQTNVLFPANEGKVISLQILKGEQLKEHITNVPAFLICVIGNAIYEDEKGRCKEKIYTEDEMLALAGISSEEEQRNLKIEANPNIHELGIYIQNKNALKRAQEEIMNLNNTIQVGDATLGITK